MCRKIDSKIWSNFRLMFVFVSIIVSSLVETSNGQLLIQALVNTKVRLPCAFKPEISGDKAELILWYRNNISHPIYSLDARNGDAQEGTRFSHRILGKRGYFDLQNSPPYLQIEPVELEDTGSYRCRVDFWKSPTVNIDLNLLVIVPTTSLMIKDRYRTELSAKTEPFIEGKTLVLICESHGGIPLPNVTWWHKNKLIDDSWWQVSDKVIRNELLMHNIDRNLLGDTLKCESSNTNLTTPLWRGVQVDMSLKPTNVHILDRSPLKAGHRYKLHCASSGSRPAANVTWWKGNKKLMTSHYSYSADESTTSSVLVFEPKSEDNNRFMACRAQNDRIPDSAIEDGYTLQILYIPRVTLEIMDHSKTVAEYSTVYFKCKIEANPSVSSIGWRYNGEPITNNFSKGISIGNQSLVLNRVSRHQTGAYSCMAKNSQGEGESNPIKLIVQYAPVCVKSYQKEYGVALQEKVSIACQVDASPANVKFKWTLRSQETGRLMKIPSHKNGLISIAEHIPLTDYDYGELNCTARNSIGYQTEPCTFKIYKARIPETLRDCITIERTKTTLTVQCRKGVSRRMNLKFQMEVYDVSTSKYIANFTSNSTRFTVDDLPVGSTFRMFLYAYNQRGRSNSTTFLASTLKADPTEDVTVMDLLSPALTVIVIVICVLLLMTAIVIVFIKTKNRRKMSMQKQEHSDSEDGRRHSISAKTESGGDSSSEKKSPDLIPSSNRSNSSGEVIFLPDVDSASSYHRGSESVVASPHYNGCYEDFHRHHLNHHHHHHQGIMKDKRRKTNQNNDENLPGISSISSANWRYPRGAPAMLMSDHYNQNQLFRSSNIRSYVIPQSPSSRKPNDHCIHTNCDDDSGISSETPLMNYKVESAV